MGNNVSEILLIVAAISLLVGGFVWIKPSKRDQRLTLWRKQAMEQGLKVSLTGYDPKPKLTGINNAICGMSYTWSNRDSSTLCFLPEWAVCTQQGWYSQGLPEGWFWVYPIPTQNDISPNLVSFVNQRLQTLPLDKQSVFLLEVTHSQTSLIWNETEQPYNAGILNQYLAQCRR